MTKVHKFGTFGGVFTPSILTILGVIMYLRLPMIIGEAGLWVTIGIILLAHLISVTTGLSISSIATDKKVEAGGTYYMISRSLGLPIGGTLGLALFVGLSLSVSLYLIGFSESFLSYLGYEVTTNSIRIAGSITLIAVSTI
jgi:amino acid transporter